MRKVLLGGAVGALPGLLLAVVPLILHDLDVITSDQSQIGFIGIPVMFLGTIGGIVWGTQRTSHSGKAMLGLFLGFVVGVALAAAVSSGLALLLPVLLMIVGAALGAWWGEHGLGTGRTALRH